MTFSLSKMSLTSQQVHKQNLVKIENIFPEKILSWKYFEDGFDSFAYEINRQWIFKIPRRKDIWQTLKREKEFLDIFYPLSPIKVPKFEFFATGIVGYKKIIGQKLTEKQFNLLNCKQKEKLAKNLGEFLKKLHFTPFKVDQTSDYRNFFNKEEFEKFAPKVYELVLPRVPTKTRENILKFLKEVQKNKKNFDHIQGTVHADLYDSHIFWDKTKEEISGIIDFGEISKNAITMDFTLLADFCSNKNDSFLKTLLSNYDSSDSDLFRKIKIFSKIEKLYWPLEDIGDTKVEPERPSDLEKNLEKVRLAFSR